MKEIIIILLLIVLNGLFSLSEIALISARKSKLSADAKRGSRSARRALEMANEPDRFLSTVQIGITLIGILTGLYSGDVLAMDFAALLTTWGVPAGYVHPVAQSLIVVIVTYLSIVAGELVPKRIGLCMADRAARLLAPPMHILSVVAKPFVWLLSQSTIGIVRLLGIKENDNRVTEEEIKTMIQEGAESGEVQEVEQDIMERVFVMGDLKVSSIMTYRKEVVCLDMDMEAPEVKKIIHSNLYEAYPVTNGSMEEMAGIVTLKALIVALESPDFSLDKVVVQPLYLPENMTVYKALELMKEHRTGRALVCDEYGSMQGIVTTKDILEGLVGEVGDIEGDEAPYIVERSDGQGWLVDGQCPLYEFLTRFDCEDLSSTAPQCNTLAGLLLELMGRIPETGERVAWHHFHIEIVDMDGARIDKVLVTQPEQHHPPIPKKTLLDQLGLLD